MTSNVGSEHILDGHSELVESELHHFFKPEFLNRVDEIITFNRLTKDVLYLILNKIINEIELRLSDLNIKIELTKAAKDYFVDNGYDEAFGARPLKRLVNKDLETVLARKLINNEINSNSVIKVDYNNKLIIK